MLAWLTGPVDQILNDFGGILLAVIGVIVIGVGTLVTLLGPGRRRQTELPSASTAPEPPQQQDSEPVELEQPANARGRIQQLRVRLSRSNSALGRGLLTLIAGGRLDEETWQDMEDILIAADLGPEAASSIVTALRERVAAEGAQDEATIRAWLHEELLRVVDPTMDRRISSRQVDGRPAVILVVGVNGTGKTTTVGKLARVMVAENRKVTLGAADTFRAAAADQLTTWGQRVGVPTVRSDKEGADPAAVAFEAVKAGAEAGSDVVIVDTAGRLHNKTNLMDELGKIKRVIEKQSPLDEVLLVLDATTGQNGLAQAEVFAEAVNITGIVLTKLDGTAKGGIVVAVQRKLKVPVKLVGIGEGADDLAPFDPTSFVDSILGPDPARKANSPS
ncbi:Cell division protein FtsY homolog [Dermatophilus congolensis]|uniref:Signal recognition particle receptor FtsY n=1 Tax=Dermatophilus congolensis TaxID=1863 RepID=A0A239VF63_9MICO|nr:signal recognition particle-docking protein FtsY [Dermatophilus congolensis]SNV20650.1 Cell division protein FtsY homolog [Dermatophilus congolensis]